MVIAFSVQAWTNDGENLTGCIKINKLVLKLLSKRLRDIPLRRRKERGEREGRKGGREETRFPAERSGFRARFVRDCGERDRGNEWYP